jgi:hypothetical protein
MRSAKLKKVIEDHLPYEIRMLFETYGLAAAAPRGSTPHSVGRGILHPCARVLHEFLTDKPKTGIHAKHVTRGYTSFANGAIDPTIIKKLSDHVAHLSTAKHRSRKPRQKRHPKKTGHRTGG